MSRQYWVEAITWTTGDGVAIVNTSTETIIFPDVTIPANYMADGRILRLNAMGRYSTTGTPTLRFRVRWGGVSGTVIADSGTITSASGVTNAIWKIEVTIITRSNGSTGTLFAMGEASVYSGTAPTAGSATGAPGIAPMGSAGIAVPAAVAVDLTADTALSLTATWGTASASNTLTGHNLLEESLN